MAASYSASNYLIMIRPYPIQEEQPGKGAWLMATDRDDRPPPQSSFLLAVPKREREMVLLPHGLLLLAAATVAQAYIPGALLSFGRLLRPVGLPPLQMG